MLREPNPNGRANSDVLLPWVNSLDILRRPRRIWIVDFGDEMPETNASQYEKPFEKVRRDVYPLRSRVKRKSYRDYWWLHAEPCSEMRRRIAPLSRYLVTTTVSKHRVFAWLAAPTLPDHQLVAFARDDDYFFGVLHSRFHEVWALKLGTRLETRPRYTPTSCFETFPFPEPTDEQKIDISTAAIELNELREKWLNPPEWTTTRMLEFPGATDGPWSRFVVDPGARGIGTVRYPRVEARDDDCAKKLAKRTLTNLYNERPAWLANAHAKLDAAVAAAYSFPVDLTDEQILERLLALNQQRIVDEKPATKKQPRVSRAKTDEEFV
jgi:type II restriction/modification system DNA methylase subunit YeeA